MQPQQQHTVVVPAQQTYVTRFYTAAPVVDKYRSGQSTVIGILLIIAGALSIIFNIVDIAIGSKYYGYFYTLSSYSNGTSGHGIWCGIMIIIAGGFGIGARNKNRCMIVTFLVLAIIGAVLAAIQMIVAAAGAGTIDREFGHYIEHGHDDVTAVYAMEILLALLGVGAFALCLWGSILCCVSGVGCGGCCAQSQPAVVTVPAGQPQVTVVSQQQQQQPVQVVAMAPGPAYPQQPVGYYPAPPQYPVNQGYQPSQ